MLFRQGGFGAWPRLKLALDGTTAMIFEREGRSPIEAPAAGKIASELSLTKSSYASLTAPDGSYVQAGGGPGLFLLEYCNQTGQQYRALQSEPVVPFPDGTIISFSGSNIALAAGEWVLLKQVTEVFTCFLNGVQFPAWLQWQQLGSEFQVPSN